MNDGVHADHNGSETIDKGSQADDKGDVTVSAPLADPLVSTLPPGLPAACARDGESRRQTWERLRREARAVGMTRKASLAYATSSTDQFHPHFPPMPEPEPPEEPPPEPEPPPPAHDPLPDQPQLLEPLPTETAVAGLADLPDGWPSLPANASLAAEVGWVQANRLRVVQSGQVDLSRALSPAPSHAALSWLETAILFPSKFADVSVKAAQTQQDGAAETRRERAFVAGVRALLADMDADV